MCTSLLSYGSRESGKTLARVLASRRRRSVWRRSVMPPSLVTSPPVKLELTERFFTAGNWKSSGLQTVPVAAVGFVFISTQ